MTDLQRADKEIAERLQRDDDETDPPLCRECSGSGEGQYDGTRCWKCGGRGVQKPRKDDDQ